MARVKASERIRLTDGDVMTLGEALDAGRVFVKTTEGYGKVNGTTCTLYVARETNGDLCWQIGQKLYESRVAKAGT